MAAAFAAATLVVASAPAATAQDPARTPDAIFIAKAAEANAIDRELAKLGADRAVRADLRTFARQCVDAAAAIDAGLQALAASKGIEIAAPPATTRTPAADLAARPAADFDAVFVAAVVARQDAAVALYEGEARDGRDDEVKEWAARQLPALREHQAAARGLEPRPGS
jgi:putative membrane protein